MANGRERRNDLARGVRRDDHPEPVNETLPEFR